MISQVIPFAFKYFFTYGASFLLYLYSFTYPPAEVHAPLFKILCPIERATFTPVSFTSYGVLVLTDEVFVFALTPISKYSHNFMLAYDLYSSPT